ncbi:sigma-54-dependent Fis family transcriptional regulator [Puteibacter caeruleilacunae]|nr:sigma-54-dependent Fis family transcriptional regulator [Puteibacter caeruleilacunae]
MNILVVDDEALSREAIASFVEEQLQHDVTQTDHADAAIELFKADDFQVVITDIKMPGKSGITLLKELKTINPAVDVIVMTGFGDMETSIKALKFGATDYLLKPVNVEELAISIEKIDEYHRVKEEITELQSSVKQHDQSEQRQKKQIKQLKQTIREISGIGQIGIFSASMKSVVNLATKFHEDRTLPVLINGETGTGKEIIARLVHFGNSDEESRPFVTINCSAISPSLFESELFGYVEGAFTGARKSGAIGKLEAAQGGTLFLDEIGELPLDLQPKLLRVLQQKEMYRVGGTDKVDLDVRIVCATNRPLEEMVKEKTFRSDLYYRLNLGSIIIPALRERPEEILPLALLFLEEQSQRRQRRFKYISSEAQDVLTEYEWPGNIRELQNAIERITLLYDDVEVKPVHLSFLKSEDQTDIAATALNIHEIVLPDDYLDINLLEREIVRKAMLKFDNNKSKVADYLGITRSALRSRLNKL